MSSDIAIRPIHEDDAPAFLRFLLAFDRESRNMMIEPGERSEDVEECRQSLRAGLRRPNHRIFVAESAGEIVGYLEAAGGRYRRIAHRANVTMGLLEKCSGRGLGRRLLEELETWARIAGIERLELSVLAKNERAVNLYLKTGYEIEGRKKKAMKIDGEFAEGLFMAKIL